MGNFSGLAEARRHLLPRLNNWDGTPCFSITQWGAISQMEWPLSLILTMVPLQRQDRWLDISYHLTLMCDLSWNGTPRQSCSNFSFSGIGVGLFILAFVWVLALFVCVAFSEAQGGLANAGQTKLAFWLSTQETLPLIASPNHLLDAVRQSSLLISCLTL